MRSQQLELDRYATDKSVNHYFDHYDPVLEPWIDRAVNLLELGIHRGGSLLLWRDYFPKGAITGIDLVLPPDWTRQERIQMFQGDQADTTFLSQVANQVAPAGFDIIIDDASHLGALTRTSFWHLFEHHLKPAGLYVLEDWGTGYWDDWPDGKRVQARSWIESIGQAVLRKLGVDKIPAACHSYGMVGLVKELVDEQGALALTSARSTQKPLRESKFEKILITPFQVFVTKKPAP